MNKFSTALLVTMFLAVSSPTASAGFFLQGAKKAKRDPTEVLVKYAIQPCVVIADGSNAGMPGTEYWLIKDGAKLAMFEREAPGKGAIIENQWEEDDGTHFFVWVRGSHGWEYVVPHDRSQDGVRLVYPKGSYKRDKDAQGNVRPRGNPVAKCALAAEGSDLLRTLE